MDVVSIYLSRVEYIVQCLRRLQGLAGPCLLASNAVQEFLGNGSVIHRESGSSCVIDECDS